MSENWSEKCSSFPLWANRGNFESFLFSTTKEADKFRIPSVLEVSRRLRKIYHINLISTTLQSLLLTREKWKIRKRNQTQIPIRTRKKASAGIDFERKDVEIHVRIIMCSCHILCPSSDDDSLSLKI